MSIEVKVPTLPESVADATLVNWHKKPGDSVKRDENLVDLETDKVVLEIPAPADGVMGEILQEDGATVSAGDVIAKIEEGDGASSGGGSAESAPAPSQQPSTPPSETTSAPAAAESTPDLDELSPAVRRLVAEHNLDVSQIKGSGRNGRITKSDVLAYMEGGQKQAPSAPAPASAPPPQQQASQPAPEQARPAPSDKPSVPPDPQGRVEQRVPMTRLRQRIAQRLVQAQQTAAMLTTFNEINMQPVMELRGRYKDKFEKEHDGVRLGFMSFFVKACTEALKRFPAVNGSIDGSDIIYHGYYDVGIAVSSPRGLVVPILRNADQMSFAEIERTIGDFGKRARDGSLTMEELTGGTFSITNGGIFGSLISTPILNPPQSAILGMHKIQDRPMAEKGQIVIRPMMYVALTYDHRIIDGREAVSFLVAVKECLEDPARLLLQV
ncbi:MAG: 2-oxoglutarate dehydrogenase complex dihydrolipoyllysine-residue succinyltransferase [Candidatus Competibacterales bacterium]|nr:2-oxoglutarate dehydrogenase complex dihydrolipoyllysine-residue succinyltransferase [Candidatus Competibacterales bacterium]